MKKVKTITIILAILLITLVAFGGVYIKTKNRMENKVKDYTLGRELIGGRVIEIKVEDEQSADILNEENYEIVKATIEKRLNNLNAQDYTISLNKENGAIRVELLENQDADNYAYYLVASGKVELKEKDTENQLLDDSMVQKATYTYSTNVSGTSQAYLNLKLTKEGQAKIAEVSQTYAVLGTEIDEIEAAKSGEENSENTETTDTTDTTDTTNTTEENTAEPKKISVLTIGEDEYDIHEIDKNTIKVKIGGAASDSSTLNNNVAKAAELAMLINSGKYPVEYDYNNNRYEYSNISTNELLYFAIAVLIILVIIFVVLCIKYRVYGLLCSISCIGFISLLSLILRYTNVLISIEGIGAILLVIAINLKFEQLILSKVQKTNLVNEAVKSTYKEVSLKMIPIAILSIIFCLSGWANLSSFGMVMFWGLILIAVYNVIVTKTLLKLKENK